MFQFLHRVQASALQIAIGRPEGQFMYAMEARHLIEASPITDHLLTSLFCYYNIHKESQEPPHKKKGMMKLALKFWGQIERKNLEITVK